MATTKKTNRTQKELQIEALRKELLELGLVSSRVEKLGKCLGTALARRLAQRRGGLISQTVAFSLDNFPVEAADQLLPPSMVTRDDARAKTWTATTQAEVTEMMNGLLSQQSEFCCAGASRALRTTSEKVVRVLATPMPEAEISWVDVKGVDKLYINFQYVLWDEDGELHPPKEEKREVLLAPDLLTALRQQVMSDLLEFYQRGAPLAPGFLRNMGHMEEADAVQAMLLNRPQPQAEPQEQLQQDEADTSKVLAVQSNSRATHFEVERIIGWKESTGRAKSYYLVQWAGYHETWEPWRISGEVGDPIETWEPEAAVINTEAMISWRAEKEASSPP